MTVARAGERRDIVVEEVVDGDVVELSQGTQIVADGTVLASDALEVDESLLSGESAPLAKEAGDEVLSGSFVTAGQGWYRAEKVGADSYANQVTAEARRFSLVRSELRRGTDDILRMVTWLIVPTAALLIASQMRSHESVPDAVRGTVAGVGAMVLEGLVLLTSLAFTAGVLRLGRRNVLVQELAAIEGLARVDVVCADKTWEPSPSPTCRWPRSCRSTGPGRTRLAALGAMAAADPEPNASGRALAAAFRPPRLDADVAGGVLVGLLLLGRRLRRPRGLDHRRPQRAAGGGRRRGPGLTGRRAGGRPVPPGPARPAGGPDAGRAARRRPPAGRPVALVVIEEQVRANARATLAYFAHQGVAVKVMSADDPARWGRWRDGSASSAPGSRSTPGTCRRPRGAADLVEATTVFGRTGPRQKQAMIRALQSRGTPCR